MIDLCKIENWESDDYKQALPGAKWDYPAPYRNAMDIKNYMPGGDSSVDETGFLMKRIYDRGSQKIKLDPKGWDNHFSKIIRKLEFSLDKNSKTQECFLWAEPLNVKPLLGHDGKNQKYYVLTKWKISKDPDEPLVALLGELYFKESDDKGQIISGLIYKTSWRWVN